MQLEAEQIKAALHEALNERDGIDRTTHRAHHDYIHRRVRFEEQRDHRRQALHDKVKATVIGAAMIAFIGMVGSGLYNIGKFVIDLYTHQPPPH